MKNTKPHLNLKKSTFHIPELDGIRGMAILSVLFYHLFWFTSPGGDWSGIELWIWKLAQVGWTGVNIFFVLSGFLITRILISQKQEAYYFERFYLRRILRIGPLFILVLIFILLHYPNSGKFIFLSLCFLNHMAEAFGVTPCYPGLWSLSIEEQFYFVWPQVIRRATLSQLKKVALSLCVLGPFLRGIAFHFSSLKILSGLLGGFDGLAFGALIAIEFAEGKNLKRLSYIFLIFGVSFLLSGALFGIVTRKRLVGEMFLPTLIYFFVSSLMSGCLIDSGTKRFKWLSSGFLRRWGTLSYAAYLFHYPIPELVNRLFFFLPGFIENYSSFWASIGRFVTYLFATYLVSSILHVWIEMPFLKLKSVLEANWFSDLREKTVQQNQITV